MKRRLAILLALALPLPALAQTVVTAHPLALTLKLTSQDQNHNQDFVVVRGSADAKDVFFFCTGEKQGAHQGVYLFLDCDDPNDNQIAAVQTSPLQLLGPGPIGQIVFDTGSMVQKTHLGDPTSATIPVEIKIDCNHTALVADLHGIMDLSYSRLHSGKVCPRSASVKVTGPATSNQVISPPTFVIDDGSSISIKTRSGAITTFPPPAP